MYQCLVNDSCRRIHSYLSFARFLDCVHTESVNPKYCAHVFLLPVCLFVCMCVFVCVCVCLPITNHLYCPPILRTN